jgi:hypothetical protein
MFGQWSYVLLVSFKKYGEQDEITRGNTGRCRKADGLENNKN